MAYFDFLYDNDYIDENEDPIFIDPDLIPEEPADGPWDDNSYSYEGKRY